MALHVLYDADGHFIIDPVARSIKNASNPKITLSQGDHNSEQFTFEIPKVVDGHDMTECTNVEIHFINIDATDKTKQSKDYFVAENIDEAVNADGQEIMIFTWDIEAPATKYLGTLDFCVRFACVENNIIDYQRFTGVFSGISIGQSIYNAEHIVEERSDIVAAWMADVEAEIMQRAENTLKEAIENGTISGGLDGFSPIAKVEEVDEGAEITITDKSGTTSVIVENGKDGKTPEKGTDYYTEADKEEMVNEVLAALPTWTGGSY